MPGPLLRGARRAARRRGQAAVLLALSIFAMLLLLAMATNMGTLVNDKVRMQSTADLSTYAVAYSEAASLNRLAQRNRDIAEVVRDCREQLEDGPIGGAWPGECDCFPRSARPESIIESCKARIDDKILRFVDAARYDATVGPALSAGSATARANFEGVERRLSFFSDVRGSPTRRGTFHTSWETNEGPRGRSETIADFDQVTDVMLNYSVQLYCPADDCDPGPIMPTPPVSVAAWFYKDTDDPDLWVAGRVAGTPEKRYLDTAYASSGTDGGYFGASSTGGDDLLVAYAVAKPYDGSVGPTRAGPAQRSASTLGPNLVYWSHAIDYTEFTMLDDYRARMAGINDDLAGSVTPRSLVEDDGWRLGRGGYDMDRFEH
jgi:hypothetical protein